MLHVSQVQVHMYSAHTYRFQDELEHVQATVVTGDVQRHVPTVRSPQVDMLWVVVDKLLHRSEVDGREQG